MPKTPPSPTEVIDTWELNWLLECEKGWWAVYDALTADRTRSYPGLTGIQAALNEIARLQAAASTIKETP